MHDDPFEIAVEHCAWCIRQGMQPEHLFAAFTTEPIPVRPSWGNAVWLIARLAGDMAAGRAST